MLIYWIAPFSDLTEMVQVHLALISYLRHRPRTLFYPFLAHLGLFRADTKVGFTFTCMEWLFSQIVDPNFCFPKPLGRLRIRS